MNEGQVVEPYTAVQLTLFLLILLRDCKRNFKRPSMRRWQFQIYKFFYKFHSTSALEPVIKLLKTDAEFH